MSAIKEFIWTIFHPSFWIMNDPCSYHLDEWLAKQLTEEQFTAFDGYRATIGGKELWVENYPYGCMTFKKFRPKRRTIYLAYEKLMNQIFEEEFNKDAANVPQAHPPQAPAEEAYRSPGGSFQTTEADSTKEAAETCQHTYTTRNYGENIQVYCTKCGAFTEFTRDGIEQPPKV